MAKKFFKAIIVILLFSIVVLFGIIEFSDTNINHTGFENDAKNRIKVYYVSSIDGDTAKFKLNNEIVKVRFIGINAPEIKHNENEESESFGDEASVFVKNKLENAKKIEIEYEKNADEKDKYDRILAWIWIDDKLIQEEIVSKGLAKTYMLQKDYKYYDRLKKVENKAKETKVGIWK